MSIVKGSEKIVNPLQKSALNKKGLCDYVINVASGCLHGCTFCYVPSTPAIRTRQAELREKGVTDPQMDWGQYLFIREEIPERLEKTLSRKKSWHETPEGRGVVLLCSGTDPYQNKQTASVTRGAVEALLRHNKRVRILTRSPLWVNDLDILKHPNVIVGMSLPYLDDELSSKIEPHAPPPSERYKAFVKGHQAECRLYVAAAPTPPKMALDDFKRYFEKIMQFEPEVIFWEPINARGTNGKRMVAAGLEFASSIMTRHSWAERFKTQWEEIEAAAKEIGCIDRLHIWPDPELRGYVEDAKLEHWLYKPTVEKWDDSVTDLPSKAKSTSASRKKSSKNIVTVP
ncbi:MULTISPECIES: radical SAM protein [unclassified Coleofasciculus]|uniref:SPL family radical SAM protein n=1 Tax=Cyanophyceae TaxID=3028117 RepID=UPI0016830FC2|nr:MULTISPECIES: radical SAM protein [unclassified Coleofasciculus]MBD2084704.1 radical SAM protein [Coleofasciculus sp. FACHB-542]MBD2537361.1 radical SAM protein [Coleofasciculus sp. FACHB-SPT36]